MEPVGWIKAYRKFIKWRWFKTPNMFHLFCYLLFAANREDGEWEGIVVKRGQLVTGRKKISADTGVSEQSVRTCLDRLKSTNEITITSTKHYSIITICKYESYQININDINQLINQQSNQQLTNSQPTGNHYIRNIRSKEDIKEEINKEEIFSFSENPKKEEKHEIPVFLQEQENPYKKFFEDNPDFQP